jgi:hypothetical protein
MLVEPDNDCPHVKVLDFARARGEGDLRPFDENCYDFAGDEHHKK